MSAQNKQHILSVVLVSVVLFSVLFHLPGSFEQPVLVLAPLKQVKSGVLAKDVKCNQGLILVLKTEDDSPACIKDANLAKLVSRGWAKQTSDTTQAEGITVTLEQNNKAISIKKGQNFLLNLGNFYDWSIDIQNQTVVSKVTNLMVIKGAQGQYQAHNVGETILTATGDPVCYKETPRCLAPSILFRLDINVTQ